MGQRPPLREPTDDRGCAGRPREARHTVSGRRSLFHRKKTGGRGVASKPAPDLSPQKGPSGATSRSPPSTHALSRVRENARAPRRPVCPPAPRAPPGGSRRAARPRPRPPPAQTPALEASGAREAAQVGEGASLRAAGRLLTYLRPPQARVPRARDNGASAANTPRVSIRGCLLPTLARRRDRGGESDAWERQPHRLCVPCVPRAGLRARSGSRGPPGAAGPGSGGRTQVSRHLRPGTGRKVGGVARLRGPGRGRGSGLSG